MTLLRSLFSKQDAAISPEVPGGDRAYAVGDVHGRLDLLDEILERIEEDIESRGKARIFIVFLGDLIDRGPSSAEVVERLRTYRKSGVRLIFLCGNHEEVLLRLLRGESDLIRDWLRFGGAECAASYGIDAAALKRVDPSRAVAMLRERVPRDHQAFLKSFADTFRLGDYLFVHAGLRPGVPLQEQSQADLRWIRQPFLDSGDSHGFVIVHGHTICEEVDVRDNRIGLDTGAYRTGVLTAIGIEGTERWFLQTGAGSGSRSGCVGGQAFGQVAPPACLHSKRSVAVASRFAGVGSVKALIVLVVPALAAALTSCADSRGGPIPYDAGTFAAPDPTSITPLEADYKIAPLDKLNIKVFRMEDLSGEYDVDLTGHISLPLVGEVMAADVTTAELDRRLTSKLGEKYLENPDVSVGIKSSTRRSVTVDGAVKQAGSFPMAGPMTLMQAVALAGGTSEDANARRVAIFRQIDGQRQAAAFDLTSIRHGEAPDPRVYPGDIIVIDGSAIKAAQKQILNTLPIFSIFRPF